MRHFFRKLALVFAAVFGVLLAGCSAKKAPPAQDEHGGALFPVRVQLDWFPEPEHGGLYQALAKGYFKDEGLDVTLIPGGSNVLAPMFVGTGQAEIGQSSSTQVIQAVQAGMPVQSVAGIFHRMPTGLMMHESNPVATFPELNGKTIMARPEAVFIPYIKKKYGINFAVIPQNFSLAQFLADPNFIQEGFFIAEPYFLEKQGAKVKWLPLWDSGYTPSLTLFANTKFAGAHPEQVRAFLRAFIRGWKDYLEGDPAPGNALMKANNKAADDGFFTFCRDSIIQYNLARGDPAKGEDYGTLDLAKIQGEIAIMEEAGVLRPGQVTAAQAATTDYLPPRRAAD